MNVEDHAWWSPALGREMALRRFGRAGRPLLAFPPQGGRFWDFPDYGMVECVADRVEAGRIQIFSIDGIDFESWTNHAIPPPDRARRHGDWDRYVAEEVAPFVRACSGRETAWTTGCSMGAFHAANLFFRHPDLFDGVVAMSGLYQVSEFVGGEGGMDAYYHSPIWYLPGLEDPWALERYRRSAILLVAGQGAWEDRMVADTRAMGEILRAKGIPAVVELWGHDVNHDWPWWRRMFPWALDRLGA